MLRIRRTSTSRTSITASIVLFALLSTAGIQVIPLTVRATPSLKQWEEATLCKYADRTSEHKPHSAGTEMISQSG